MMMETYYLLISQLRRNSIHQGYRYWISLLEYHLNLSSQVFQSRRFVLIFGTNVTICSFHLHCTEL